MQNSNLKTDNIKVKKIQYRIAEIKKLSHYENDFSANGLKPGDLKNINFVISVSLSIDRNDGIMSFKIEIHCYCIYGEKNIKLFGIETLHKYKIKYFNKLFRKKDSDIYKIPDLLILNLLNSSISDTRGMIAALNTTPEYRKIILPPINTKDILKSLKKQFEMKK